MSTGPVASHDGIEPARSSSPLPAAAPQPSGESSSFPYAPQHMLAAILLIAALVIIFGTGLWCLVEKTSPRYTCGGAAAAAGTLLVLALILEAPTLIMDDAAAAGGEPSTMRILTLAIILTFCLLMLRTGWNSNSLPDLKDQSNWVWLVTAALGGKAVQKYAEIQDKRN